MATQPFNSVAEIESHFNTRLAAAADEDKAEIRAEAAEAKVTLLTRQAADSALRIAKAEVLAAHPALAGMDDFISGGTKEEMEARAVALEARVAPPTPTPAPPTPTPAPAASYGTAPIGVPATPPPAQDELVDQRRKVTQAYRTNRSARTLDFDVTEYGRKRFREAVNQAKASPSYRDS